MKYIISHKDYLKVADELREFMVLDPYATGDGYYAISSLYYDSLFYDAYRSKIDGILFRRKLRHRIYPESEGDQSFVEIKQRINKTVQKRRIIVPFETGRKICAAEEVSLDGYDDIDRQTINEIHYMVRAMYLRPACIISYRRQAFVGCRYDLGLRITFDSHLKYRMHNLHYIGNNAGSKYFIPPEFHIMEIKANERVPIWLTSFLAKHQCMFTRVSKYCTGLKHGFNYLDKKRTMI